LFMAFVPLWQALNGADEVHSPYRRMVRMAAADAQKKASPVDAAARTLGISSAESERWLERILDAWREATRGSTAEPWDYRFRAGAAERQLAAAIPREALQPLNERYYRDLGLDLATAGVIYDLQPRAGKAPLAYTDYVRRGSFTRTGTPPTCSRCARARRSWT
jgi:hypothetical protein